MTGSSIVLRIRTKKGVSRVQTLTGNHSLNDLKKVIVDLSGVEYDLIKILKGYPPKPIESTTDSTTLGCLHLRDGDLLTVEECDSKSHSMKQDKESTAGILLRKIVPADNSCLFTSVHYVVNDGLYDLNCQKSMRQLIANAVKSDEVTYSEAFLGDFSFFLTSHAQIFQYLFCPGKKNKAYQEWIQNTSNWVSNGKIFSQSYSLDISPFFSGWCN
jgi:hypothetical protein